MTDLTMELVGLDLLRPHPDNPRNGDVDAIAESLTVNGQYKPIVVAKDGTVLAGNHTYAAALQLGWTEIQAVRLQVGPKSKAAKRIMLADNRTSDLGVYDEGLLLQLLNDLGGGEGEGVIPGTGYDTDAWEDLNRRLNDDSPSDNFVRYSAAAHIPHYQPAKDVPPPVERLFDERKALAALDLIPPDAPDDVRAFLTRAATRLIRFDYGEIAEYYAHADRDTQQAMEALALVIVDVEDAIRLGYARLGEFLDDADGGE